MPPHLFWNRLHITVDNSSYELINIFLQVHGFLARLEVNASTKKYFSVLCESLFAKLRERTSCYSSNGSPWLAYIIATCWDREEREASSCWGAILYDTLLAATRCPNNWVN